MKRWLLYLWRWDGTVDRGPYALIGLVGFALKHNLDRLLATVVGLDHPPHPSTGAEARQTPG